jgi:hypothetical protein
MGLPASGQTLCYDMWGTVIDCDSDSYPGQDGFHQAGCPTEARFVDNEDGTVTDTCTGLVWQQETAPGGQRNWQQALQYCEDLDLAGHDDWRLPNCTEILSILNSGGASPTSIDPVFSAVPDSYWSSYTVLVGNGDEAVIVSFSPTPYLYSAQKTDLLYVRAVRGGFTLR